LESFTRAMHAHLQRPDSCAKQVGHLFVRPALDVFHHEGFAQRSGQSGQRTIEIGSQLERQLTGGPLSISDQEFSYGVTCMAVPLVDVNMPAALGLSYSSDRSARVQDELAEQLLPAASRISKLLSNSDVSRSQVVA